jgi:hypothetical protein
LWHLDESVEANYAIALSKNRKDGDEKTVKWNW